MIEVGQEAPKGLGQRARLAATEVGLGAHNPKGREVPEVTGVEVGQKVLGEVGQGHTVRLKVMPREVQEDQEVLVQRKVSNQIRMIL